MSFSENMRRVLYFFNMLESICDPPVITEIVDANPNEFDMDIVFQHYSRQVRN